MNHEKIKNNSERVSRIKTFIKKHKCEKINLPSGSKDRKD